MTDQDLVDKVRRTLPKVQQYLDLVVGDPDMELVLRRVDQVETLLEAMAVCRTAGEGAERAEVDMKLKGARVRLSGPLFPRSPGSGKEDELWSQE